MNQSLEPRRRHIQIRKYFFKKKKRLIIGKHYKKKDMHHPFLETFKWRQGIFQQALVSQQTGYEVVKHR